MFLFEPKLCLAATPLAAVHSLSLGFSNGWFIFSFPCALKVSVVAIMLANLDTKSRTPRISVVELLCFLEIVKPDLNPR